ncbi:MAG: threonylcarbamoyl-AMP synthase [candidate division Zixibacteria bacterium]|nr:threonylcarbamoyl-AMP synthase [candidate division Zixibacteria bacterium]
MVRVLLDSSTDLAELAGDIVQRTSAGEVVLVPTETQYGLCCNAEDLDAIKSLNRIKRRSIDQPSALFVRDWEHASAIMKPVPDGFERFLSHFWPGALTVVAESLRPDWPGVVTSQQTIGLRCSAHPLMEHVAAVSNVYLTATSANPHGEPPSAKPELLIKWLADDVELFIFDSNVRDHNQASTVVDITVGKPRFLRVGEIEASTVLAAWEKEIRGG